MIPTTWHRGAGSRGWLNKYRATVSSSNKLETTCANCILLLLFNYYHPARRPRPLFNFSAPLSAPPVTPPELFPRRGWKDSLPGERWPSPWFFFSRETSPTASAPAAEATAPRLAERTRCKLAERRTTKPIELADARGARFSRVPGRKLILNILPLPLRKSFNRSAAVGGL